MKNDCILILGCGYVGCALLASAVSHGFTVFPVSRDIARVRAWSALGYQPLLMGKTPSSLEAHSLQQVTVIIDSIPLERGNTMRAGQGEWLPDLLLQCPRLRQAIYLSSTSVYGNADGAWVGESWPCQPSSIRGQQRVLAEDAWHNAMADIHKQATVFRLAGIYGPNRNIYKKLQAGGYRAIRWQPDHISNRIHVDDIVAAILAAIKESSRGTFNISDDAPSSHADYVTALAKHIHAPPPHILSPEEGKKVLSPALLSFFQDSKRLDNSRMHAELLPSLRFPSFLEATVCHFVDAL